MASFDDLRKEMYSKYGKKKEEDEKSSLSPEATDETRNSFSELRSEMTKKYDRSSEVDDKFINTFITDANSYLKNAKTDYDGIGYSTAASVYDSRSKTVQDLTSRAGAINSYLRMNRDKIDAKAYSDLMSQLDEISKAMHSTHHAFYDAKRYYSQWDTEDEYNLYLEAVKQAEEDEKKWTELTHGYDPTKHSEQGQTGWDDYVATQERISQNAAKAEEEKSFWEKLGEYMGDIGSDTSMPLHTTQQVSQGYLDQEAKMQEPDERWTEEQKRTFGYLWDIDRQDAYAYAYSLNNKMNIQQEQEQLQQIMEMSTDNFWAGAANTVGAILTSPLGMADYLGDLIAQGTLGHIPEADGEITPFEYSQAVTGGISQHLNKEYGTLDEDIPVIGGKGFGDVYGLGTSIAQSSLSAFSGGQGQALVTFFGSAAASGVDDALSRGANGDQAIAFGTMAGIAEGLAEMIGVDNLMNIGTSETLKQLMWNILKQGFSEGIEEGVTSVLNNFADNLVMGDKSNFNALVAEYMKQGLSEEEAKKKAWMDTAEDIAFDMLGGFVSGAAHSGPLTAMSYANTQGNYTQSGNTIMQADGGVDSLKALANEVAGVSDAKMQADLTKQAGKVSSEISEGKGLGKVTAAVKNNINANRVGRLYDAVQTANNQANASSNQADIAKSLERKGFSTETANDIAEALVASYNGQELTNEQRKLLKSAQNNQVVRDAVSSIMYNAKSTMGQRSQNIRDFQKDVTLGRISRAYGVSRDTAQQMVEGNFTTAEENGTESHYEVSVDGKTIDSEGNAVSINGVSFENGRMVLVTEDGNTIDASSVSYGSQAEALVYESVANLGGIIDTDTANKLSKHLLKLGGATSGVYVNGIVQAYTYGYYGYGRESMNGKDTLSATLTEAQRNVAYGLGEQYRNAKTVADQETVAKKATGKKTGKVHFEGDRSTLTERQSASLTAMEKVADALGVQIYVFESELNERGKRVGANGWYDPKDGSIHIDLHAGANGEGTMLFTVAHELTHFIRQWSPAKFKILADFLMQEYGKKGVNVDALVREQMEKAKRNGRTISYDTAYEEVVADSMEMMLSDGQVMEKLAKLKQTDESLWQKIKDFISDLVAKVRAVYEGLSPDSVEGRYVAEMVDSIEKLQELFTEGLVDAGENYQSSLTPGEEGIMVNQNGDPVAHATADGTVQLSMRTYEEDGREAFRAYLQKCVTSKKLTKAEMQEMLDGIEEIYQACKEFKDKYAPFGSWSDAAVVRDTYGKPVFSVVTPNGDYKMNLDFSLVCKKRRTLDAVFNEMSKRGIIDNFELGQKSVVKIIEIIRKYGLETACALCFVDAKRFRQASMADSFTRLYNELVESLVPEEQRSSIEHFNFSGYETIKKVVDGIHTWDKSKLDFSHIDHVLKTYGDGTVEYKAAKYIKTHAEGRKLLLRGDFMSSQGFDAVKTQNKDILKLYNSKKGTGGPKAAFGDVQYMNEIIQKARWWTPAKAYSVGGVRIQSFSDYVPRMVFDYVQMVYDLAATKLPAHAYTKEALFVKQFGLTGIKINMSLIPAIVEGGLAPGLDANGNYVWAGESFDYETAKEIQNAEGYTENCGTICVGVSYEHIVKLLRDPNIRMVIPYHKSGLNPIVAHMNKIAEFTDYTNDQRTKGKDGKALEKDFDFSKALHDMGEKASPKAVADQYLKWCAAHGYTPRFAEFAMEENYYKLLEDFTLYDKDGNYVPQREVRAVFPKEGSAFGSMKSLIEAGLQEDAVIEGKRDSSLSSIVDEIQRTLPKTEAEISEDQVEQADRDLEAAIRGIETDVHTDDVTAIAEQVTDVMNTSKFSDRDSGSRDETYSAIGKEHLSYEEGDLAPDLTLVETFNERTGKTETTIKHFGQKPKDYVPKRISYCYKLFEQHPDGSLHALFAGAKGATPIGIWQFAQGFPYTDAGVKGMNLRERYGWHLSAGLPSAPHLMSSKDFSRGYPSKNAYGHPKGSKRVWVRMAYDASTDFNAVADSTRAGDIFGLIPFGGYYAFKENNQSEWVISSAVKIDKILTEEERQQILSDAGYDEYEAWRRKHRPTEAEKAESKRKSAENKKAKDKATKAGLNYLSESSKAMREAIQSRIIDNPEIRYSDRDYSYEALTSKPDMVVTEVGGNVPKNRADIVAEAKKNAAKVGRFDPKTGSVSVHVGDIGKDVVLGTVGLKHGLEGRRTENAIVTLKAGEILQNSIRINELTPKKEMADSSYVLIGAARSSNGDLYIVRSVVNTFKHELISMDVLYAINAKKGNRLRSMRPGFQGPVTDSTISIAELLDYVNQYFPDILPENVLKHYGHDARPGGELGESALYSDRNNAPTFYSQMAKVVDGVKQEKLGAASVVNMLRGKGVKAEEIKWSGIEEWLAGKKSVTKAELQEFIAGSMLQIGEQTSGTSSFVDEDGNAYTETEFKDRAYAIAKDQGIDRDRVKFILDGDEMYAYVGNVFSGEILSATGVNGARWSDYKLDGGENYREIVFTLPNSTYSNQMMRIHWGEDAEGVLAHARIQDMNTFLGKMLFIEEIQSDYHNEGHQSGYADSELEAKLDKLKAIADEKFFAMEDYSTEQTGMAGEWEAMERTVKGSRLLLEYMEARDAYDNAMNEAVKKIPDAPFKDTYHEFVLKRLIREAAEKGYDSIGWTPAEIQVKRWSEEFAEGYRIEYDQDIPKFMSKYGKKWGTKVGKTVLDNGTEVWSMAITDSMKDSVLTEGLPLYSDRDYQNVVSKAVNQFGTTTDFAEAGFILPSGEMLRFTDDKHKGERQYDHRAIGMVYGEDVDLNVHHGFNEKSGKHLVDFVENGGIRFDPGSMEFNFDAGMQLSKSVPLTAAQEQTIRDFIEWKKQREEMYNPDDDPFSLYRGPLALHIDFGGNANTALFAKAKDLDAWGVKHLSYEGGQINADRIIADIRHYYKTGETRKPSLVAQFLSDRDTESVSNRSLLANAFEGVAQNDIEKQKIQEYKGKIALINAEERKLTELNEKIKELSFAKGPKDTKAIRNLQFEAKQTANRINTYDKQLLRLEASKPLQDVLQREKKMAYQRAEQKGKEALAAYREKATKTQRELLEKWQTSRKKGIDSRHRTAMRHKIKDVVNELNQYLLRGTKDRHVPIELQKAVAEALDVVNMDTVGAEERIAKLQDELMKAKTPEQIQEISRKIDHIQEMGDKMNGRLKKLKDAYDEFVNSDDPLIANSHDDVISNKLQSVIETVGDTPLRDMTLAQLEDVYDMYRMVLTTIRNANKAFKAKKSESISTIANRVMMEVEKVGGKKKLSMKGVDGIKGFVWNNLKPVYAFEHIGSDAFTEVFNNVRAGEDVWAVDVTEAREYYLDKSKKHNYDSWDFKKRFKFTSSSGMDFELNLEQIMSLYAYSKRDQAAEHLKKGGIVIDETTEITVKNKLGIPVKFNPTEATAYNISPETLADIISKLTNEQKSFVDEMQDYLSTVMGAKGNEVSLVMYGVKLFKEKFYFPLKSAQQFMAKAKEQQQGDVKIKNSGFSKETVQKASNPIVLTPFMNVWSNHVNEMSMYHAFVLPMEDFYRVYNYKTPTSDTMATESVEMFIQNAYGKGATKYIDQLLKDLNGGARTDHTTGIINKMMGLFKKGAVFASLSVVVQQPSAIARAAALVDTKYFIGPKVDHKRHKALWDEVKQYAPVAVIKEMGYFDTNMGKSTQDFILGKEYSGFSEKMKALVTDSGYRDEILSKAPALADELAWCSIWEAVKRETKAKYPGLDTKAEPFLMLAGSRFTEVIVKTQVYDSVLSRSGLMRSKDTGMKMATSFMAEPTTSINMIADALLQGKRGNKKYARNTIGAVIASQILNSILVSFVYAARDDDEDETYWEKYLGTLTGEILDSLNPLTYIPFIKDIVSIVQGYDVERSDMAVISDLWNAYGNLGKDNVSPYRKVEGFAGSIAQIFGLPVKNIMRDARGIYQTIESFMSGQQTTAAGIGHAIRGSVTGKDVSNQEQLYEAYLSGDKAQIARVEGRYKDKSAIESAIRKGLRENDPRIREAAVAWNANDLDEYMRIAKEIIAEKHFTQDDVVMAIRAEANALTPGDSATSTSKAKGLFTAEKFASAIAQGDQATAYAIKTDIIQTAQKNGKTAEEAEKSFNSSAKTELKDLFLAGEISEQAVINALTTYCGAEEDDALADVQYWAFKQEYPEVYADDAWFDKYYEEVADSGISVDMYMEYRNQVKDITGEGKKEKRMEAIDSLPITKAQKDALYYAEGWAASKLYEAPWH